MIDLNGKHIVVSGASSGIGRAIAQKAASLGASLLLFGRNAERLEETRGSLHGTGHRIHAMDITDYANLEQTLRASAEESKVSGFVHSAGIEKTLPFRASTPRHIKEVFEVNVFAGFEMARILSQKGIVDPVGAAFVFISSINGRLGDPFKVAYCASKSALSSGIKAMALELAPKKIRCNCVLPGYVNTEMVKRVFESIPPEAQQRIIDKHPLGLGKPEDIASLVCFLLSDQARWITGSDYTIDGGYSAQ